jgi:lipopolysaccharide biosynthesis glycosyltransferase
MNLTKKRQAKIHIMYACDTTYAKYASVSVLSLAENTEKPVHVHVCLYDTCDKTLRGFETLENKYSHLTLDVQEVSDDLSLFENPNTHLNKYAYARLLAISNYSASEKLLYLDVDTVVENDVSQLFDLDLKGYPLGGVEEAEKEKNHKVAIGMEEQSKYYNTGVLLVDIPSWKKENVLNKAKHAYKHIPDRKRQSQEFYADQDLLNVIFEGRWRDLPARWNPRAFDNRAGGQILTRGELKEKQGLSLIHFNGKEKPWQYICRHPLKQVFWTYAKKSPFTIRELNKNIVTVLKKQLRRLVGLTRHILPQSETVYQWAKEAPVIRKLYK